MTAVTELSPALKQAIIAHYAPAATGYTTPGELARHIDPRTVQTPALDLIDAALVELLNTPDGRLIVTMPPQEGKSTRGAQVFPIWALKRNPDLRIVSGSYAQRLANRNGRAIRNQVISHPGLGLSIAPDNGSASEWTIAGHEGGVLSVGRGAGVTGRPADLLIIDDPLKDRKEADSLTIRDTCWDWWTDALSARLAPGAPVLVILTRWHEDDLAGRLLSLDAEADWKLLNIPAQCEDPENDPLGREAGEFMQSARLDKKTGKPRTRKQWEARKATAGSRTWASLYQGRPAPADGGIVKSHWWQFYDTPQWTVRDDDSRLAVGFDEVLISCDFSFKDTAASDYVAMGVWGRRGIDAYLLDQVHGRFDFVSSCRELRALAARWPQAILKIVEDKANGTAVMAALRNIVTGLVPENPREGKTGRVNAISPFIESGHVKVPAPELAPWIKAYIDEHTAFPNGTHDDQVDQTSQAVNRLLLQPLLRGDDVITEDDFYDDEDDVRIGY